MIHTHANNIYLCKFTYRGKIEKNRDVDFFFTIVDTFGFSKYRVGVGFGFFKYRDIGVDFDYSTHL